MNHPLVEHQSNEPRHTDPNRRQHAPAADALILNELDPDSVFDHLDGDVEARDLTTFGSVRETCPKCQNSHLKLVLRQGNVRLAHLFCAQCTGCFDAHYANGASALTI